MLTKENITSDNFEKMRLETAKLREDVQRQGEALEDTKLLREFALDEAMTDEVVELYLEEVLIHQHSYMEQADTVALANMKSVLEIASDFVARNQLSRWESRIFRFFGRVADYEKKYQEAVEFYKKAIAGSTLDPKYADNRALAYEYRGFLILDELRLGGKEAAIEAAEKLYEDYEATSEGAELKGCDFTTWAIWRSGIYINMCRTLIDLGLLEEYRERILKWLDLVQSNFKAPDGVQTWSDFGFRKNEIERVREMMKVGK